MVETPIVTIVLAVIALLGGAFGSRLLDRWFDRNKVQMLSAGEREQREFADNEQARRWLQEQLRERDEELQTLRANEIKLLTRVGELGERVGRHDERSSAQGKEIQALQKAVEKLGMDYSEMKGERDLYRKAKHEADNQLTSFSLRAQLAEREVVALKQEIDQLKGQLAALAPRRLGDGSITP